VDEEGRRQLSCGANGVYKLLLVFFKVTLCTLTKNEEVLMLTVDLKLQ